MGQSCALLLTSFSFTLVTPDASGRRTKADKLFFFFFAFVRGNEKFRAGIFVEGLFVEGPHTRVRGGALLFFSPPGQPRKTFFLFEIDR